jgi:hypothetical protein
MIARLLILSLLIFHNLALPVDPEDDNIQSVDRDLEHIVDVAPDSDRESEINEFYKDDKEKRAALTEILREKLKRNYVDGMCERSGDRFINKLDNIHSVEIYNHHPNKSINLASSS